MPLECLLRAKPRAIRLNEFLPCRWLVLELRKRPFQILPPRRSIVFHFFHEAFYLLERFRYFGGDSCTLHACPWPAFDVLYLFSGVFAEGINKRSGLIKGGRCGELFAIVLGRIKKGWCDKFSSIANIDKGEGSAGRP